MSIKNRPNFHAVDFAIRIIDAMNDCVRGDHQQTIRLNLATDCRDEIISFVEKINDTADQIAKA